MGARSCLAIVLAAGDGTRMRSSLPKVMHSIGARTLLAHVLAAVGSSPETRIAVVTAPGQTAVAAEAKANGARVEIYEQHERRGTAHAVLAATKALEQHADDILVLFADSPLVRPQTLQKMRDTLANGATVALLGFRPQNPTGYGRLIMKGDEVLAIREDSDCTPEEKKVGYCNGGLMALAGGKALEILQKIGNDNRKKEYYLSDAVEIARGMGLKTAAVDAGEDEVRGINTKAQLAEAEAVLQQRLRATAMEAGVTMVAPDTVFLSADTKFGKDVTVEPHVVFGPGVVVDDGATIRSFSHLEGAHVGKGARVGPYARLRPGADLGVDVHIGNFVEVKAAKVEQGAKANHLAYIGDGRVGENANIGAGTIFCNYDGAQKHHTDVGKGAFIGSNSALVAPVKIGDGAYVGSGSVVTRDVPAEALALERAPLTIKEGWAKRLRDLKSLGKKKP